MNLCMNLIVMWLLYDYLLLFFFSFIVTHPTHKHHPAWGTRKGIFFSSYLVAFLNKPSSLLCAAFLIERTGLTPQTSQAPWAGMKVRQGTEWGSTLNLVERCPIPDPDQLNIVWCHPGLCFSSMVLKHQKERCHKIDSKDYPLGRMRSVRRQTERFIGLPTI